MSRSLVLSESLVSLELTKVKDDNVFEVETINPF